jgi:hypothetical protein
VQLAQLMYDIVRPLFPISSEAFEDYQLNAVTFSGIEMMILKQIINQDNTIVRDYVASYEQGGPNASHLSKRELDEFKAKFSLV